MKYASIKALIAKVIAALYGCFGIFCVFAFFTSIPGSPSSGKEPSVWAFSILLLVMPVLLILVAYQVIFRYSANAIKGLSILIGLTVLIKIPGIFWPMIEQFINKIKTSSNNSIIDVVDMLSPLILLIISI